MKNQTMTTPPPFGQGRPDTSPGTIAARARRRRAELGHVLSIRLDARRDTQCFGPRRQRRHRLRLRPHIDPRVPEQRALALGPFSWRNDLGEKVRPIHTGGAVLDLHLAQDHELAHLEVKGVYKKVTTAHFERRYTSLARMDVSPPATCTVRQRVARAV